MVIFLMYRSTIWSFLSRCFYFFVVAFCFILLYVSMPTSSLSAWPQLFKTFFPLIYDGPNDLEVDG